MKKYLLIVFLSMAATANPIFAEKTYGATTLIAQATDSRSQQKRGGAHGSGQHKGADAEKGKGHGGGHDMKDKMKKMKEKMKEKKEKKKMKHMKKMEDRMQRIEERLEVIQTMIEQLLRRE